MLLWQTSQPLFNILLLFANVDRLNPLFDVIVPIYVVFCFVIIVINRKTLTQLEKTDRIFTYEKKSKAPIDWKLRFVGKWEKTSRENWPNVSYMLITPAP